MKNTNIFFLAILVSLILFDCSNNDDSSSNIKQNLRLKEFKETSNGGNVTDYFFEYRDDGLLDKYTSATETVSILNGTTQFEYDNDVKITRLRNFNYSYNLQDQLITINRDGSSTLYAGSISYTNEGLIDTINGLINSSGSNKFYIYNITYNNLNQVIIIDETVTGRFKRRNLINYDNRGNITEIIRQESRDDINFTTKSTLTYTYDNKPNLNKKLFNGVNYSLYNVKYVFDGTNLNSYKHFNLKYFNPNNITSITELQYGDEELKTYSYNYNNLGYPISAEYKSYFDDSTLYQTLTYDWVYETY